jgi:hypothetical protein
MRLRRDRAAPKALQIQRTAHDAAFFLSSFSFFGSLCEVFF